MPEEHRSRFDLDPLVDVSAADFSSERLLDLLRQARDSITESQRQGVGSTSRRTGNRRNQKRHQELLALLEAIITDTEIEARVSARETRP
jgi:hypothetical protein